MSNFAPYANLKPTQMAGNYGPSQKMRTAMAAYTPNIPWAKFGCSSVVDFDGRGTSAATPQIAAAAALWITKNKTAFSTCTEPWMKVEMVRAALFGSANKTIPDREKFFGQGALRVQAALATLPAIGSLKKEDPDSASFAFLKVLTVSAYRQKIRIVKGCSSSKRFSFLNPPVSKHFCRTPTSIRIR